VEVFNIKRDVSVTPTRLAVNSIDHYTSAVQTVVRIWWCTMHMYIQYLC